MEWNGFKMVSSEATGSLPLHSSPHFKPSLRFGQHLVRSDTCFWRRSGTIELFCVQDVKFLRTGEGYGRSQTREVCGQAGKRTRTEADVTLMGVRKDRE